MTDLQPTPIPATDFTDWEQEDQAYVRLADEWLPANKTSLFDALAAAGIETVVVVFDGYGDSGQIEAIEAKAGGETIALPLSSIEIALPVWSRSEIERQSQPIREAIETLAYAWLGQTHGGWEDNDGAYGDFTFDVAARTITLDYNERYTASENFTHEF